MTSKTGASTPPRPKGSGGSRDGGLFAASPRAPLLRRMKRKAKEGKMSRRSDEEAYFEGGMKEALVELHWNDQSIPSPFSVTEIAALENSYSKSDSAAGAPASTKRSLFSSQISGADRSDRSERSDRRSSKAGGGTPSRMSSKFLWRSRRKSAGGSSVASAPTMSGLVSKGTSSSETIDGIERTFSNNSTGTGAGSTSAQSNASTVDGDTQAFFRTPSLGNSVDFLSLVGPTAVQQETKSWRAGQEPSRDSITNSPRQSGPSSLFARDRVGETVEATFHLKYPAASILELDSFGDNSLPAPSSPRPSSTASSDRETYVSQFSQSLFEINQTNQTTVTTLCSTPNRRGQTGPVDVDEVVFLDAEHNLHSILELARKHIVLKEFEDALDVYSNLLQNQKASLSRLQSRRNALRNTHTHRECQRVVRMWIGTTLHNLAVTCNLRGHYKTAVRYAEEAVSVRRVVKDGSSSLNAVNLAESLVELGLAHYALSHYEKALLSLREALQRICQKFPYNATPAVAKLLNLIGCVHFETGQLLPALASYEESLDIQRSTLSKQEHSYCAEEDGPPVSATSSDFTLLNVSTTLCNIGFLHWKQQSVDQSISFLEEALMLQESVLGDSDGCKLVQNTSAFIAFLSDVQEEMQDRIGDVDPSSHVGDGSHSAEQEQKSSNLGQTYTAKRAVSFMTSYENQAPSNSNNMDCHGQDFTSLISVHYVFHSISCISLGSLEALSTLTKAADKRKMSFPNQSDKAECRNRLRDSIQQCLQYYGSMVESRAPDFRVASNSFDHPPFPPAEGEFASDIFARGQEKIMTLSDLHFPSIHNTAIRFLLREEYSGALNLYQSVLMAAHSSGYAQDNEDLTGVAGMAFHHIGVVYLYAEEFTDAKKMFHKAAELRMESCKRFSSMGRGGSYSMSAEAKVTAYFAAAVSLTSLALAHFLLSQYEDAVIYFSQSLRFLRQVPRTPWIDTHLAQVWNNIACTYVCMGRGSVRSALSAFDVALSSCLPHEEKSFKKEYQVPQQQQQQQQQGGDIAKVRSSVLSNLGHLQVRLKEYAEAIVSLEEALQYINDHEEELGVDKDVVVDNLAYAMACANSAEADVGGEKMVRMMEKYKEMLANHQEI